MKKRGVGEERKKRRRRRSQRSRGREREGEREKSLQQVKLHVLSLPVYVKSGNSRTDRGFPTPALGSHTKSYITALVQYFAPPSGYGQYNVVTALHHCLLKRQ